MVSVIPSYIPLLSVQEDEHFRPHQPSAACLVSTRWVDSFLCQVKRLSMYVKRGCPCSTQTTVLQVFFLSF